MQPAVDAGFTVAPAQIVPIEQGTGSSGGSPGPWHHGGAPSTRAQ